MKVTFRVALVGLLAAAIIVQTASATSFSVMHRGAYYMPETGSGSVVHSTTTDGGASGPFAEIYPTSAVELAVHSGLSRRAWEDVAVCSPSVGDDPIHRYAAPSFWTITGSPVENVDFLFSDKTEEGRRNEISQLALDNTSMAEQQCVVRSEHIYSSGRLCLADGADSAIGFAPAHWGMRF